jgi:Fanconi anemia group M protein
MVYRASTLIILPTDLGKTVVASIVVAKRLELFPLSKVLFLAPTRPLVEQHSAFAKNFLNLEESSISLLTGEIEKRGKGKVVECLYAGGRYPPSDCERS